MLPILRWITWPLIVGLGVAAHLFHGEWTFALAFIAGAFLGMYLVMRDSPPEHVEWWLRGSMGERQTARALRPLRKAGWTIIHDLPNGKGNFDHVAVGPGGVVLLDSKRLGGEVAVSQDGVLEVRRLDDPEDGYIDHRLASRMRAQAAALRREATIHHWVDAVVVLWCPFPQGIVRADRVTFAGGSEVLTWMRQRPRTLTEEGVADIAERLQAFKTGITTGKTIVSAETVLVPGSSGMAPRGSSSRGPSDRSQVIKAARREGVDECRRERSPGSPARLA